MAEAEVEVKVTGVYVHQEEKMPPQHFVLLRDDKGRRMPIWIAQFEAWAISFALETPPPEVPMTHDLTLSLLESAGAVIEAVRITELRDETFYSAIGLRVGGERQDVAARPSDAIALALRAKCPISVAEEVIAATARD